MQNSFKLPALNNKVVIGLTGALASGKSTVLKIFKELGAFTLSADEIVAAQLMPGAAAYKKLKEVFGTSFLNEGGTVNKKAFAEIIFNNEEKRKTAEGIIHPLVFEEAAKAIEESPADTAVFEVPLLFESNTQDEFDLVVCVFAGDTERQKRAQSKGLSPDQFNKRDGSQMPLYKKISLADCVINNTEGLDDLKKQVTEIYEFAKQIRSK